MRAAVRTFKEKVTVVLACRRAIAWERPSGLDARQVMPEHILHFITTLYENYGLNENYCHIPLGMWFLV